MEDVDELLSFDYEWRVGNRDKARQIACNYIDTRRSLLSPILSRYTLEELVTEVDNLMSENRFKDKLVVDMWLLTECQPQIIKGELAVTIKKSQLRGI